MTNEIWKDIAGYEGLYQVSNLGRVKSFHRNKEKIMNPRTNGDGYKNIQLCNAGVKKVFSVHRLVAEAFIPNPENKPCVDHIDTNSLNNNVENLRWVTIKENNNNPITIAKQKDRLKSYNNNRKIRVIKFKYKDYNNIEIFDSVLDAAKSVNDSSTNISRVCKKYCFMYENDFNRTFNE